MNRLAAFVTIIYLIMIPPAWAQKSDHIIHDSFGDWSVRHVFDRNSLAHRYSDAKTDLRMPDGRIVEFQINRSAADQKTEYILPGWLDKVTIKVGDKDFTETQSILHTFYGSASPELLNSIANSAEPIEIKAVSSGKLYTGTISPNGASAALRWIRAIK